MGLGADEMKIGVWIGFEDGVADMGIERIVNNPGVESNSMRS